MEILFKGVDPKEREYIGTCACCKTQVKFKANEGRFQSSMREESFYTVECPVCSAVIYSKVNQYERTT